MNTYRLQIQPDVRHALAGQAVPSLTEDAVAQNLAGVVIRELATTGWGPSAIDLHLQRPTHEEALNDIAVAVQELGYSIVEATVSEWADALVEGAVIGALGGGAIGSASQDPGVVLVAALAGTIAGAVAGSRIKNLEVIYQVQWTRASGWVLTPLPQQHPNAVFRPGFSPS